MTALLRSEQRIPNVRRIAVAAKQRSSPWPSVEVKRLFALNVIICKKTWNWPGFDAISAPEGNCGSCVISCFLLCYYTRKQGILVFNREVFDMPAATVRKPEQKRVTITSKRQFTIPQKFYTELGFDREAICTIGNGMLIIQPAAHVSGGGEFAEQILSDLIAEGFSGQELLDEFKTRQAKVRPAVEALLEAAKAAASGTGEYSTYDDIFGAGK